MGPEKKYRAVFKRMETDVEFKKRVLDRIGRSLSNVTWIMHRVGKELDDDVWAYFTMQRRIIEDVQVT